MPQNTLTHPMSVISSTSRAVHTGLTSFWLVPVCTIPAVQVYIFGSVSPPGQHIILLHGTHHIYKQNCILFVEHSLLETCASNVKAQNKLYNSTRYFCYTFQIKIAIEPGAFHYTFWCHDQLLNLEGISGNSQNKRKGHFTGQLKLKLNWFGVVVSDIYITI